MPKCLHNGSPDKLRVWIEKRGYEERERDTRTLRSIQVDEKITGAGESTREDEEFTSGGKTWAYSEQILFYASRNFNYDTHAPLSVSHFKWIIQLRFPPSVPWVIHVEYSNELFNVCWMSLVLQCWWSDLSVIHFITVFLGHMQLF